MQVSFFSLVTAAGDAVALRFFVEVSQKKKHSKEMRRQICPPTRSEKKPQSILML